MSNTKKRIDSIEKYLLDEKLLEELKEKDDFLREISEEFREQLELHLDNVEEEQV